MPQVTYQIWKFGLCHDAYHVVFLMFVQTDMRHCHPQISSSNYSFCSHCRMYVPPDFDLKFIEVWISAQSHSLELVTMFLFLLEVFVYFTPSLWAVEWFGKITAESIATFVGRWSGLNIRKNRNDCETSSNHRHHCFYDKTVIILHHNFNKQT